MPKIRISYHPDNIALGVLKDYGESLQTIIIPYSDPDFIDSVVSHVNEVFDITPPLFHSRLTSSLFLFTVSVIGIVAVGIAADQFGRFLGRILYAE